MQTPKKLIILDRDGVINADSDEYIKSPGEWHPIPGSLEAIARLNQNGYQVAIATNQMAIARGLIDMRMLNAIGKRFGVSLKGVPMVGDALRDMQAAFEVGCVPYLVRTGKGERTLQTGGLPPGTQVFDHLAAAVEHVLQAAQLASDTTEIARSVLVAKR